MPALLPVPALPHILHKIPLTKHPVRPAPSSELHLLGEDPRARLLSPNRARPRLGHPWLHHPLPNPCKPSCCGHRSLSLQGHSPWGQRRGRRCWDLCGAILGCPCLGSAWGGAEWPSRVSVPPSLCRQARPCAAPGVNGGKYCLCFSNIGLLFCICRFFKDREPPLPRFQRRYPQQCRPRSPPHSKKTNVRPRIDMK